MREDGHSPLTLSEIYNQARSCEETVARADERQRVFEKLLPLDRYSDIVITGCGSSLHLAVCASFAWSEMLSRPVTAAPASELTHFPERYLRSDARPLIIAISRSGGTTEVRLAVERLRRDYRARSLAMTGEAGGSVAEACDAEIAFTECREKSVVMTQAFTCMLAGLYLLADGASGNGYASEITRIPSLIDATLRSSEDLVRAIAEDAAIDRFVFLGSGPMKGLADECALKMTEMALETSVAHRSLEFRHGPKAALSPRDQVIIFPVEAEHPYLDTLLREIKATGARVLTIPQSAIRNPQLEILRPALCAHVGQLLAYWRANARGLDPDAPPHLTRTVLLNV